MNAFIIGINFGEARNFLVYIESGRIIKNTIKNTS